MTEYEASKIRSAFSNGFHGGNSYLSECDMDQAKEYSELLDIALKKQIPQKPTRNKRETIRYTGVYSCPNCRQSFSGAGVADYCYHCGQRLDWSDFDKYMFDGKAVNESETR